MNLFTWLDDGVCDRLMLTFAHFLWQGVAIGLLAGLIGFLMRRRSAGARYLLFTSSLLAMVACPPVTYCLLPSLSLPRDEVAVIEFNPQSAAFPDFVMDDSTNFPDVSSEADLDSIDPLFTESPLFPVPAPTKTDSEVARVQSETANWSMLVRFLTYCYMLGVVLLLGRFVLGMQGAARIRRSSRLLDDPEIQRAITRRAKALGLRNAPPVLLCQQLLVPAVVGIMRPAILFPVAMISGLTPQQVEDVLTHELAHIRRYDHLVNVIQRVVESFLFFHPAVWFVSRRIRIEREHCCDDLVISMGTAPVDYAAALLSVVQAGSTAESRMPLSQLASLPAVGNKSELRRRIERLVDQRCQPQVSVTRKGILMTSLTTMIVLAGSMLFSATFQADEKTEDQKTAQTTTQPEKKPNHPTNSMSRVSRRLLPKMDLSRKNRIQIRKMQPAI
jgi:beta-lactamase regulating signal transducer with metallopeptidase domain